MNEHPIRIFMYSAPISGTISMYRLPDNSMVYRPASDDGHIDFEPLRKHIGKKVEIYRDGSLDSEVTLVGIKKQDGVDTLIFEPPLLV